MRVVHEELLKQHVRPERVDGPEFVAYCACVARLRDAQERIEVEQLIVPDGKNQPTIHPAFAVERQCMDELRKWGDKFKPRGAARVG